MVPEIFPSPESAFHFGQWKTIIGLLIVLFASFVGVEIKIGKDDEEK